MFGRREEAFDPFGPDQDQESDAAQLHLVSPEALPSQHNRSESGEWNLHDHSFQSQPEMLPFLAMSSVVSNASPDRSQLQGRQAGADEDPLENCLSDVGASQAENAVIKCQIVMQEQLSIKFDGSPEDPSCQVIGSVHMKLRSRNVPRGAAVNLTLHDKRGYIERNVKQAGVFVDAIGTRRKGDRVLRISLQDASKLKAPVISYSCSSRLKPVPMLAKLRTKLDDESCRVSMVVRANPKNKKPLSGLAILMIVPPDVDGTTVQLSKEGAVWDDLKRMLSFGLIPELNPGEILHVHASFQRRTPSTTLKFPLLIRCESEMLYSGLEASCVSTVSGVGVEEKIVRSSKVMFRKV